MIRFAAAHAGFTRLTQRITLRRPDDWHVHLRDGDVLARTVADCARGFARAIVMPNLQPPVVTTDDALAYRERVHRGAAAGASGSSR